jgi:hypothetical protein
MITNTSSLTFLPSDLSDATAQSPSLTITLNNKDYEITKTKTLKIVATLSSKSDPSISYSDSKTIYLKGISEIEIEEELPEPPTVINGSFPEGFTSDDLVIIYNTDESYSSTLDIDSLNKMALDYMANIGKEVDSNTIYYQKDSSGRIYVLVRKDDTTSYDNDLITLEDGTLCYKVYIDGSCEIVGFQDNSGGSDFNLELGTGYYYAIANQLYLFNCVSARLVNYNTTQTGFWLNGETESDIKMFTDQETYKNHAYYLAVGSGVTKTPLPAISSDENVTLCFTAGTMRKLVISDTIETIEYFADIVNATDGIIISSSVKKIGDYAFYGSSISGQITINSPQLEEIGRYAFANMTNLSLLNINADDNGYCILPKNLKTIKEYAFYRSSGLNKISFSSCEKLTTVEKEAFSSCSNLRYVKYLESQVEPDNISSTQLLYLPPDRGTGGNYAPRKTTDSSNNTVITALYAYDYTSEYAYPNTT